MARCHTPLFGDPGVSREALPVPLQEVISLSNTRCAVRTTSPHRPATYALSEQEEHRRRGRDDYPAEMMTVREELPSLALGILPEFHVATCVGTWIDPEEVEIFGKK
jgi:hypothetical protein